jgi:tetraacyldisaccharide 4'-kinase
VSHTKVGNQELFFTHINYDSYFMGDNCKINRDTLKGVKKVLIAGIAKPESFFNP